MDLSEYANETIPVMVHTILQMVKGEETVHNKDRKEQGDRERLKRKVLSCE